MATGRRIKIKKKQVENTFLKKKNSCLVFLSHLFFFSNSRSVHQTGRWSTTMAENGLELLVCAEPTPLERKEKEE